MTDFTLALASHTATAIEWALGLISTRMEDARVDHSEDLLPRLPTIDLSESCDPQDDIDHDMTYCDRCYFQCWKCKRVISHYSDTLAGGCCSLCHGFRAVFVDLKPFTPGAPCQCDLRVERPLPRRIR